MLLVLYLQCLCLFITVIKNYYYFFTGQFATSRLNVFFLTKVGRDVVDEKTYAPSFTVRVWSSITCIVPVP